MMLRALVLTVLVVLAAGPSQAADNTPFFRIGDPLIFRVTTTPTQYPISRPSNATSYRFVNPCSVDVRIMKVPDIQTQVDRKRGTRYLARSVEVVATSDPKFVSIIALSEPPEPCDVELQYGAGN